MSKESSSSPLRECLVLLHSAHFDEPRNLFLRGEQTGATILVTTPPDRPSELLVEIVCHTSGHLCLDWEGVGVLLENSISGETWVSFLDRNGRARFRIPRPLKASFGLACSLSSLELGPVSKTEALATQEGVDSSGEPDLFHYNATSTDKQFTAAAWRDPGGVITITVKTPEPTLQNAIAYVEFRSVDGQVLLEGKMVLDLEEQDSHGRTIHWGAWMKKISLPDDATVRVVAFPHTSSPSDTSRQG